jgi:hypothetical protein
VSGSSLQRADGVAIPGQNEKSQNSLVECGKSYKIYHGFGKAIPLGPLRSPRPIPLVNLNEAQVVVGFASARGELGGAPCWTYQSLRCVSSVQKIIPGSKPSANNTAPLTLHCPTQDKAPQKHCCLVEWLIALNQSRYCSLRSNAHAPCRM